MTRQRGFTLIELLVTLTLLALLASAAFPLLALSNQRRREHELADDLRAIRTAIDAYKQAVDQGRIARAADASGYPPTLAALVDGVPDQTSLDGRKLYFLRRLPADPMSDCGRCAPADTWRQRSYQSPPDDPAPGADVYDVASKSDAIGLNGIAYKDW